jgi:hypothetical protein
MTAWFKSDPGVKPALKICQSMHFWVGHIQCLVKSGTPPLAVALRRTLPTFPRFFSPRAPPAFTRRRHRMKKLWGNMAKLLGVPPSNAAPSGRQRQSESPGPPYSMSRRMAGNRLAVLSRLHRG